MANKILFGLCLLLAVCLHALAFMVFPDTKKTISAGALNKGQSGLSIGFAGSAGNGTPLAAVKAIESQPLTARESKQITPTNPIPLSIPLVSTTVHKTQSTNSKSFSVPIKSKPVTKIIKSTAVIKPKMAIANATRMTPKKKPVQKKVVKQKIRKAKAKKVDKQVTEKLPNQELISAQKTPSTNTPKNKPSTKLTTTKGINQPNENKGKGTGTGHSGTNIAGQGNSTQGGFSKGQLNSYHSKILAWLEKHKRYPRMAKRRRQQGTAIIYFKIDRNGHVLRHKIRKSSGHTALDREVTAMLKRANPLPTAPKQLVGHSLEFTLPVAFNINLN